LANCFEKGEKSAEHVTLLWSGGRDSSLAACLLARQKRKVHLVTYSDGTLIGIDVVDYRYNELKNAFPDQIVARVLLRCHGLFRRIALANIESDFQKYKTNLIPVGSQLAGHTEAIIYCLENSITYMATGFTKYEKDLMEQRPEAIDVIKRFVEEYGIKYMLPVYEFRSIDDVKYQLLDFGISTKSLEPTYLFGDTFSTPTTENLLRYIEEKLHVCRNYIRKRLELKVPDSGEITDYGER